MSIARKILMGSSGGKKSTYVDDVFSTYLYKGNNAANTVNTGINYSEEGGLLWIKARNSARQNLLFDTVRGANKKISSNEDWNEYDGTGAYNQTFTTTGFTLNNSYTDINDINVNYSSWNFRKQKGFFDVVTYTGNGSNRTIAHNLGSVPGCIMIKRLDTAENWRVYHRGIGPDKILYLNLNSPEYTSTNSWNSTTPTSTVFSLGTHDAVNDNGATYVAYIFAGGESTADTARSVDFPNTASVAPLEASPWHDRTGYNFGTGDFTIECWAKFLDNSTNILVDKRGSGTPATALNLYHDGDKVYFWNGANRLSSSNLYTGQWYHIALARSSGTTQLYINGVSRGTYSDTTDYSSTAVHIGGEDNGNNCLNGSISNLRIVKGTAVYTSSFRPPTEPLTNITNTVLLCCNNSSITGTTVGYIQEGSSGAGATASTDSPFDDSEGFQFGDDADQNLIKCGTYDGNPNSANIDVEIGWEPQFFMVKSATASSTEWLMWDSMRGIATDGNDERLSPTESSAEYGGQNAIDLTSTGVRIRDGDARVNGGNGQKLIYIAIRRPDGYVGKPIEAGTDAFAMDTGNSSSTIPVFDSGFPVDMAFERRPATTDNWYTPTRLTGEKYLLTNANNSDNSSSSMTWDSNVGWSKDQAPSTYQSWMWKRHAGFDVVTYIGNQLAGRAIPHSLNKVPEMMWLKYRSPSGYAEDWQVYHKGLNGGVDPQDYSIRLDSNNAEYNNVNDWNDTAPTSTHFTIGSDGRNNRDGSTYINILFASVDGISKVGSYVGSDSDQTITTGFQPRFVIIKGYDSNLMDWFVLDTIRGWGSGNDPYLALNSNTAQGSSSNFGAPTSTGFTLTGNNFGWNDSGYNYIYYAHA